MIKYSPIATRILSVVETIVGVGPKGLHEPDIGEAEIAYTTDCLRSGYVSNVGAYVDKFECKIADVVERENIVATVNGTSALHLALMAVGVKQGDEVLVPSMTFVATVNSVTFCNAVPHFVDIEGASLGIDPVGLESYLARICEVTSEGAINSTTSRRISAIVVVHLLGLPAEIVALCRVAKKFGIAIIEDAAGAIGSRVEGQHVGTFGDVGVLSFNGNKMVTAGGGGAVISSTPEIHNTVRQLATTWRLPHPYEVSHGGISYNYRMPNINAALGLAQLDRLEEFLDKHLLIHKMYDSAIQKVEGVSLVSARDGSQANNWIQALRVNDGVDETPLGILEALTNSGFQARRAWAPIHEMDAYRSCPRAALEETGKAYDSLVCLPSSSHLAQNSVSKPR